VTVDFAGRTCVPRHIPQFSAACMNDDQNLACSIYGV